MAESLEPPDPTVPAASQSLSSSQSHLDAGLGPDAHDDLRLLSRSPHPYHHQSVDLPHPAERLLRRTSSTRSYHSRSTSSSKDTPAHAHSPFPAFSKDSSPASDSGTDADDEHFLKGLPAPRTRLHKGLRGRNEPLSGTSTPLLSPAILEEEGRNDTRKAKNGAKKLPDGWWNPEKFRRTKVLIRRSVEGSIVAVLWLLLWSNAEVRPTMRLWCRELQGLTALTAGLSLLYVPRLALWTYRNRSTTRWLPVAFPVSFDPAPVLYPPNITMLVTLLISVDNLGVLLPNIILSICALPASLIPSANPSELFNSLHWALSCLPLLSSHNINPLDTKLGEESTSTNFRSVGADVAVLLYPLHQSLCQVLHYLTTTSLEPAELQLLSIALINLLLLAYSPQMVILKALLWGGGLGTMVLCGQVIKWGISLARVPKWRFTRASPQSKPSSFVQKLSAILSIRRLRQELLGKFHDDLADDSLGSEPETADGSVRKRLLRMRTFGLDGADSSRGPEMSPVSPASPSEDGDDPFLDRWSPERRHTFPVVQMESPVKKARGHTHTPSGRRKRTTSLSVRAFFKLTQAQATVRRWSYAGYVYACMLGIIFVGIRQYVGDYALNGSEPVGWALGYLLGDLPWFRFQVVSHNLERWVCLPPRNEADSTFCAEGWVQHLRLFEFGEANTRLLLSAYWLMILIFGLVVVVRLDEKYEVDTRRKVFHFMMVAMFLPGIFVDPTYAALALSLILAIFLILDLLRASQLPPLSKPLAAFLAPYVDGRDFRGPVVISHIFLLIGCAIPLWLSLASLPRTGSSNLTGWEVPTREIGMVSGVICVGLGDSAASLIGRRWGHRKWLWGGGKSLEGSLAFATAVFVGLCSATAWLRIGGWPAAGDGAQGGQGVAAVTSTSLRNSAFCASMASLTEAVLTGGNDNVIVPVVLWTCVKSLRI